MELNLLALVMLLQTLLVVLNEYPVNEGTTTPSNVNSLDIPAQFLNGNPQKAATTTSATGTKCGCAVCNSKTPAETDNPFLTQAPMNVNCDNTSEEKYLELWSAVLCFYLANYNHLTPSIYSRICGAMEWTYTDLTSPNEICCHENKVIDCKDQVAEPASSLPK